ncbi:MAG: 4-oxalocrotonate tautomerase family protein [Gammaproteobacteria bacterium]|nr:4-oxalocrotonate tautomerase family protein [Gammaproteobacteria bacterium]MCP5318433.1 4-oxalocrotonate tautomerase family protein [Chromatiaceae bacterium]MCP5430979.1 4-oxalocrotonate tautomerase family protein [Chromatiaceae bacterium]MCW5585015.1 4-oxalocrotonate tautomerase family protein [Chromatiales bacterium]
MPILDVKIAARESAELTQAVTSSLIELTSRILNKRREVTSIAITYLDPAHWIVGGRPLSEQGKSSFYFDIKITDETNTKTEKAQYIREAYAMFATLLGDLHEVSYVYVEDVRASAYGYGGLTQEHRYQH